MKQWVLLIIVVLCSPVLACSEETPDINTTLMLSTFMLTGENSTGTAFIIGKPTKEAKGRSYAVLVTAAHVLNRMKGDTATLVLRKRTGDSFLKVLHPIQIRRGSTPLWVQHSSMDVAVMYVSLPREIDLQLIGMSYLATDELLQRWQIHPGDRLSCLGFPLLNAANDAGFPILRSGQIASFPLIPMKSVKTFLFDFNVFEGNSGGPVYFAESIRGYQDAMQLGPIQAIMGLVSEQRFAEEQVESLREKRLERHMLGLAGVVPAIFIKETIEQLPETPK